MSKKSSRIFVLVLVFSVATIGYIKFSQPKTVFMQGSFHKIYDEKEAIQVAKNIVIGKVNTIVESDPDGIPMTLIDVTAEVNLKGNIVGNFNFKQDGGYD